MQYIFGMHPVLEAVKAGKRFDRVLLKKGLEGPQFRELMTALQDNGISFQFVPGERLDRVVRGAHQGVVAYIANIEYVELEDLVSRALAGDDAPILLILDGVSDVRNLGAVARTLECAGGKGIIVPAKGGAAVNAEAVKASAGALMRLDYCRVPNLKFAAYYLKQNGFRIVSATEKTDCLMYDAELTGPVAIVMGSEGKGISRSLLDLSDERVAVPMSGGISSLNVSAAAAVVIYEAVRQRISK